MCFELDCCAIIRPRILFFLSISAYLICGVTLIIICSMYEFDSYLQQQMAIDNLTLPTRLLIPIGGLVVLTSFFSYHAGKKEDPLYLLIFASIAGLLLMFTTGCFIMILSNYKGLSDNLLSKMQENQEKYNRDSQAKIYWDGLHNAHQCCGINKPSEWLKYEQNVPYSCCQSYREQDETSNMYCKEGNRIKPYLRTIGCLAKLESAYRKYKNVLLYACVCTTVIQFECIIVAVYMAALFWRLEQNYKADYELELDSNSMVKPSMIMEVEEPFDNVSIKAHCSNC